MTYLTKQILHELKLQIFNEDNKSDKTILAIYPGRFQPMGLHHKAAYDWLSKKFGTKNCFIVTSNITDQQDSPFTFKEKKQIISHYGITNIFRSDRPYFPTNLLKKYDPAKTIVVYMIGEKDKGRLSGIKRLMKYNKSTAIPYTDIENPYTYYIHCPTFRFMVPDFGEMSGTTIRAALGERDANLSQLKLRFEAITGWFDSKIFNMVISKLNLDRGKIKEVKKESLPIVTRKFWNEVFKNVANEPDLITESGAAGHLQHPFEDLNLTFGDIRNIFEAGLQGKITLDNAPTEKVDGMNLFVTFKDGNLLAARNKSDIKTGGMTYKDIKLKYKDRGEIQKAFQLAFIDLQNAISALSEEAQILIFKNGTAWMNLEIVYPKSSNVINYDGAYIVFHGSAAYDDSGNKIKDYQNYATKLASMIDKVNANTQKTFNLTKPNKITILKSKNFKERLDYFLNELTRLQQKQNCKDTDTLGTWYMRWWKQYIKNNIVTAGVTIDDITIDNLTRRWALGDTSFALNKNNIQNPDTLKWAKITDKIKVKILNETILKPFEYLMLKFGAEILTNVKDVLAINPDKTAQKIKQDVETAIKTLSSSTNIQDINILKKQLERINAAGGIKAISPIEGITFYFKGKPYKLTGVFAPINQLLGYLKSK